MTLRPRQLSAALAAYLTSLGDVSFVYLFGSYARGQMGPLSDVDVAVFLSGEPSADRCFARRLEITDRLMGILHVNDVDVVILNQAPLALRCRVLRDGILVFCRDRAARINFTWRTVSAYLDFKPVIERHERAILERARKGELLGGFNPHRGTIERYRRRVDGR